MSGAGQLASIICKNFAQNAWKKDLCSNCFKSEVEHQDSFINNTSSAPVSINSDHPSHLTTKEDIKWKTSATHPNLLSQTNGITNQSSIKTLNISINQTNGNKSNKSVNDCQNTTTTILQSSKKSVNTCNQSPQILMNTKKITSTHVLSNSLTENCTKVSDKPLKDSLKDNHLNNNSINNCLELRKVKNTSKVLNDCEENDLINSSNKIVSNNNNLTTKDPKHQNFPQMSPTKDKLIVTQTNVKNSNSNLNNISHNKCLTETTTTQAVNSDSSSGKNTVPTVTSKAMPLVGILKTEANRHLIKYRPKNKCLVFKEGDPMIIGIDRPIDFYGSDDEWTDEEDDESDDFDDDEQIYYSDDKELRELTRVNTMFNSNFANFSVNNLNEDKPNVENQTVTKQTVPVMDCKVVSSAETNNDSIDSSDGPNEDSLVLTEEAVNGCVTEEIIPEICEKLVENSLIETFEEITDTNSGTGCESIKSVSPDSGNSDILPMSTSSDSYSSSSSDEKEDSLNCEVQTTDIENFKTHLIITQNVKPLLESKHLRTDSESDNSSTNSDSGLEITDYKRKPESAKPQISCKTKPQLPVKPNISTIIMNSITISVENKPKAVQISASITEPLSTQTEDGSESGSQLVDDELYQEICESSDGMNGTEGKFSLNAETNSNFVTNGNTIQLEIKSVNEAKRDMKLAELAHELEQVRHMKRPAPPPPVHKQIEQEQEVKEDLSQEVRPIVQRQPPISITHNMTDTTMAANSSASSSLPTKPHRFSIRKLLHKKSSSDKILAVKTRDHSNESQRSVNSVDYPGADRKAWKQSEFDRTNLKIVHPIDLTENTDERTVAFQTETGRQTPDQRPEAPPRTPKPSRPSVPARRRKQSISPHLLQPRGEPPPPPPPTTPPPPLSCLPSNITGKAPVVELMVKTNDLNEAYNQLAKSNYSNLLAIKSKIESFYKQIDYKWSDFEVTNAVRLGSALLYKDSVVSKTRKSVNLLVLPDCYCGPIVTRFRHHSDLVLVLKEQWIEYKLLSELSIGLKPKLMNSLILQLYLILESLEKNNCNHLPTDTIDKIIICTTKQDCLLIVPRTDRPETSQPAVSVQLTLHQFLAQVLEKLLPSCLFGSVDSLVLSRPSVPINHSKTIVQLIVFQIPVHQMDDKDSGDQQIHYWFDINRSKFINQFCCLSVDSTKLLTHLDYNYLNFLCNDSIDLIRTSIALLVNTTNKY